MSLHTELHRMFRSGRKIAVNRRTYITSTGEQITKVRGLWRVKINGNEYSNSHLCDLKQQAEEVIAQS